MVAPLRAPYACLYIYTHMRICTYIYIHVIIYTHIHMDIDIYIYIHKYIHIYIYIYIDTYTYVSTPPCPANQQTNEPGPQALFKQIAFTQKAKPDEPIILSAALGGWGSVHIHNAKPWSNSTHE